MRLSMDRNDPAYGDPRACGAVVRIDGRAMTNIVTVDTDRGEAVLVDYEEHNNRPAAQRDGKLLRYLVRGNIELTVDGVTYRSPPYPSQHSDYYPLPLDTTLSGASGPATGWLSRLLRRIGFAR